MNIDGYTLINKTRNNRSEPETHRLYKRMKKINEI